MATIYGTVDVLALARSNLSTRLNALKTAMPLASIVPALAAVYDDHLGATIMLFPSVSIGLEQVENPVWIGPLSGTHSTDFHMRVNLRVMLGRPNIYRDEAKLFQLYQSIINYLAERRAILDVTPGRIIWAGGVNAGPLRNFDDTRTVGGELVFSLRGTGTYTSA